MNKTTISILGTGWLGMPLGAYLAAKGHKVKGSTTSADKLDRLTAMGIQPYLMEIGSGAIKEENLGFFDTDILIVTLPPKRDAEGYRAKMKTIGAAIKAHGIQKVIYTSSTGVYGATAGLVNEETIPKPDRASAQSVYEAEQLLGQLGVKLTICRLAGLTGGQRIAGRFLAGKTDLPNGNAPINLVHQEDCIRVIYQIVVQEQWNEIFNVCGDGHPEKKAFYTLQALKMGLVPPTFAPDATPKTGYKIVSNAKVKMRLSYKFGQHFLI